MTTVLIVENVPIQTTKVKAGDRAVDITFLINVTFFFQSTNEYQAHACRDVGFSWKFW